MPAVEKLTEPNRCRSSVRVRAKQTFVILPAADAMDFMVFCQRNPRPCPLLGVSTTWGHRAFCRLGKT